MAEAEAGAGAWAGVDDADDMDDEDPLLNPDRPHDTISLRSRISLASRASPTASPMPPGVGLLLEASAHAGSRSGADGRGSRVSRRN